MSSPVPLPVTRANPPIGTRSGPRHCWPPSASVCPRSAWSRWSPSSPRGSTRWRTTTVTAKNLMARDIKTAESYECEWEEWVWMREPFKPREEREWWETALDRRPLKIFFSLYVWFADKYDKLLRVSIAPSVCKVCVCEECIFGRVLLRLGEITFGQEMVVDRSELPWRLEMATNRSSTKWPSRKRACAIS